MANKNEAKVTFKAETDAFTDGIKAINTSIGAMNAQLKLNSAQLDGTSSDTEALRSNMKLLADAQASAGQKVELTRMKLESACAIFGENSVEADRLRKSLALAELQEANLGKKLDAASAALDAQESAFGQLSGTISQQEGELEGLKRSYTNVVLEQGGESDAAKELAGQITVLSKELEGNRATLREAADAADQLTRSTDEVTQAAEEAEGGWTMMKGVLADLVSNGIQAGIGKLHDLASAVWELPEATREYRTAMAKLDTAFSKANFSADVAASTYRTLYRVVGDIDQATEAANLIANMAKSQKELHQWTTILIGVFGTYGDSLPVESLAETAAETAKTGTVTGSLADALNWSSEAASMFSKYMNKDVKTAEDAFNVALSKCSNEQERQALITETLTKLYGGAAEQYQETAGDILAANDATARLTEAQSQMGEAMEPANTAWQNLKTTLMESFLPIAIQRVQGLAGHIDGLSAALSGAIGWCREHQTLLTGIGIGLGVLATAILAYNISLHATAIATAVATTATGAFAAVVGFLTSPITIAIAVITALIAIGVALYKNWDTVSAALGSAMDFIGGKIEGLQQWFAGLWASIQQAGTEILATVSGAFDAIGTTLQGVFDTIHTVTLNALDAIRSFLDSTWYAWQDFQASLADAWNSVKETAAAVWNGIKDTLLGVWNGIRSGVTNGVNAVKNTVSAIWNGIKTVTSTVWNGIKSCVTGVVGGIKNGVSTGINTVKNTVSSIWHGIQSVTTTVWNGIKSGVVGVVTGVKTTVGNLFNGLKNTVSSIWNGIKSAIITPVTAAKEKVKGVIDKIKGLFHFSWSLPKLKVPHFGISPAGWKVGDLLKGSIPRLSVRWAAKGGVMRNPTLFGGGEAGAEGILPLERNTWWMDKLADIVTVRMAGQTQAIDYDRLQGLVRELVDGMTQPIYFKDREVGRMVREVL